MLEEKDYGVIQRLARTVECESHCAEGIGAVDLDTVEHLYAFHHVAVAVIDIFCGVGKIGEVSYEYQARLIGLAELCAAGDCDTERENVGIGVCKRAVGGEGIFDRCGGRSGCDCGRTVACE